MSSRAYLSLGSNIGDRAANINAAYQRIKHWPSTRVVDTAYLYQSSPLHYTSQPPFLNTAVAIDTALSPHSLLTLIHDTEDSMGRDRGVVRYGPRVIDIDILLYSDSRVDDRDLTIPHPRITERKFVTRPLCDIAASLIHPTVCQSLEEIDSTITDADQSVTRVLPLSGDRVLSLGRRTYVMGILNVTPDSFSDGGHHFANTDRAVRHAIEMFDNGADIVDIGGASTRPGSANVSVSDECERVMPVIEALRRHAPHIPLSIDTYHASVANAAVQAGCAMVNDVSGGALDSAMLDTVSALGKPYVLMHMRGSPQTMTSAANTHYSNIVDEVRAELTARLQLAMSEKLIARWNLIGDVGIGFAKNWDHNLALIRALDQIAPLKHLPMLVGPSRKRFIQSIIDSDRHEHSGATDSRDWGTAAVIGACIERGVDIVRVHRVQGMKQFVQVADAIHRGWTPSS